jgi:hypothetical protein
MTNITIRRRTTGSAAKPASVTGAMAIGARIVGPTAMGPLAIAVAAIGALAVGRLAIANAVIKKLRAEEIEIGWCSGDDHAAHLIENTARLPLNRVLHDDDLTVSATHNANAQ